MKKYRDSIKNYIRSAEKSSKIYLNAGLEELLEITVAELRHVLQQIKIGKVPGEDLVTTEMLRMGGSP